MSETAILSGDEMRSDVTGRFCEDHRSGTAVTKRLETDEEDDREQNRFSEEYSLLGFGDRVMKRKNGFLFEERERKREEE